jgi:outer membrane receptor protein involved in Fe transport
LLELKSNPNAPARGTVIESRMEEGLGAVATVLVQDGTLRVGEVALAGPGYGRIRGLINDRGEMIQEASAATPVIISGLNALPNAGDKFYTLDDMDTKTWAVFADASYSVTPAFDVTFGGRYTEDKREARIYKRTYLGLLGSPTLGNPNAIGLPANTDMQKSDLQRTDTKFTPKLGFGWKLTPGNNLYATYSEGFKGGMFDPRMDLGGNPNSLTSLEKRKGVEPEEVARCMATSRPASRIWAPRCRRCTSTSV